MESTQDMIDGSKCLVVDLTYKVRGLPDSRQRNSMLSKIAEIAIELKSMEEYLNRFDSK